VTQYYTGKKVGLTNATLRCRGPRVLTVYPFRLAKKTNSISAKLNMQKKADAKKVAHHKVVNRNWKECKVWGDDGRRSRGDDDLPRPKFQERAIQFAPLEEPVESIQSFFESPRIFQVDAWW
jgi:hypothetical protein